MLDWNSLGAISGAGTRRGGSQTHPGGSATRPYGFPSKLTSLSNDTLAHGAEFKDLLLSSLNPAATGSEARKPGADANDGVDAAEAEKIREVAQDFEALLLYHLLKQMWATLPESTLFDQGLASEFYREMWLEEVARATSRQQPGLGVASVIERELLEHARRTVTPEELAR